jgi:hypothetical protein
MLVNPLLEQFLSTEIDLSHVPVKQFNVEETTLANVKQFLEHWHYSKSTAALIQRHVFKLMYEADIIGAMVYGHLAMVNAWKKYADNPDDVIELRRLCCIDKTPRNTESYFIGKTIRWLKKNTDIKRIVSYADPFHGHEGTIYKASNFEHRGMTSPGKVIMLNGKKYHDKCVRDINKKILNETGQRVLAQSSVRLLNALKTGEAQWVETPGKHIYVYELR